MSVVKTNYIKRDGWEKAKAKATIRYIQHRPSKTEGKSMTHSHCCELAEISNPEQLWYYKTYHDLHCKIFSPEYRIERWSSPFKTRKKARQNNTLVHNPTAAGDSNGSSPGKEKERLTRTLFGRDGAMGRHEAYRMIDEAEKGSVFYRFIMSPDPQKEDTERDLRLREVTAQTMLSLEERTKKQVQWVAAEHADHTAIRHVHIVAVIHGRLQKQEFQALPQVLRHAATEACIEQRRELDIAREQQAQEREEAAWERSH